ncbi:ATP-binding protein [Falsirhodobacter halotolerans]|nr:ATP-binding protein [Falsirhodobacter halotolerans]MCJ8139452.1 ATP-binding protein [Falsirhodobacter halotolerans]
MAEVVLAITFTFWTMAAIGAVAVGVRILRERALIAALAALAEDDPVPSFATRGCGARLWANRVARTAPVDDDLMSLIAEPDLALFRLRKRAAVNGWASDDIATTAAVVRLSVHRAGPDCFVWRLERRSPPALPDNPAPSAPDPFFDQVPLALLLLASDGTVRRANATAREQLHLTDMRAGVGDLFEGLGRSVVNWVHDVAEGRVPPAAEVLKLKRGTGERYVQIAVRPMPVDGKAGVLAVLIDATALKVLEAQFNQSQKMQAIGQLAGGVAHDFNNLLTAISGHCDLLLLRHDPGDPEYSDLVQIHQNANRAASLVGQLLAFSRKQTQKLEPLDLPEVLSDLTHLLNRLVGERVRLRLSHAAGLGRVQADRRQLEQVIMNLVVNARDAMPQGGEIRIETASITLKTEMRRNQAVLPAGDYSVICVGDSGVGIPAENLDKIFEPFFTTKRVGEGTGLGLSTVYGIVKQTGGYIFVDSAPGQGSTFHIYLPRSVDMVEAAPAPAPLLTHRQGEGVVLLVEDEAPVRAFASRALRLRGYTVVEAASGEDALTILEDATLRVDLFVTDVVMPGLDGPAWVRIAQGDRPDARVIFVSGYAEETFSDEQAHIPNSVFLPKPFSLTELTMTVQRLLG